MDAQNKYELQICKIGEKSDVSFYVAHVILIDSVDNYTDEDIAIVESLNKALAKNVYDLRYKYGVDKNGFEEEDRIVGFSLIKVKYAPPTYTTLDGGIEIFSNLVAHNRLGFSDVMAIHFSLKCDVDIEEADYIGLYRLNEDGPLFANEENGYYNEDDVFSTFNNLYAMLKTTRVFNETFYQAIHPEDWFSKYAVYIMSKNKEKAKDIIVFCTMIDTKIRENVIKLIKESKDSKKKRSESDKPKYVMEVLQ